MIDEQSLIVGKCYYMVGFFDNAMSIPDIDTYIYVGKCMLPSDKNSEEGAWYFQDPGSYLQKGIFTEANDKSDIDIIRGDNDTLESMYDDDGIIALFIDLKPA